MPLVIFSVLYDLSRLVHLKQICRFADKVSMPPPKVSFQKMRHKFQDFQVSKVLIPLPDVTCLTNEPTFEDSVCTRGTVPEMYK